MKPCVIDIGRPIGIGILVSGYAVLGHYATASTEAASLGAFLATAPVAVAALILAWRSGRRNRLLALCGLACLLLWTVWESIERNRGRVFFIEHAGAYLVLCVAFGRTLITNREPMCARFARFVHGPLPPEVARYTRQVTVAWTVFFGLMVSISSFLFLLRTMEAWSIFANFLSLPLVAAMFVVEYAVRRRVLPTWEHVSILEGVRAFRDASTPKR